MKTYLLNSPFTINDNKFIYFANKKTGASITPVKFKDKYLLGEIDKSWPTFTSFIEGTINVPNQDSYLSANYMILEKNDGEWTYWFITSVFRKNKDTLVFNIKMDATTTYINRNLSVSNGLLVERRHYDRYDNNGEVEKKAGNGLYYPLIENNTDLYIESIYKLETEHLNYWYDGHFKKDNLYAYLILRDDKNTFTKTNDLLAGNRKIVPLTMNPSKIDTSNPITKKQTITINWPNSPNIPANTRYEKTETGQLPPMISGSAEITLDFRVLDKYIGGYMQEFPGRIILRVPDVLSSNVITTTGYLDNIRKQYFPYKLTYRNTGGQLFEIKIIVDATHDTYIKWENTRMDVVFNTNNNPDSLVFTNSLYTGTNKEFPRQSLEKAIELAIYNPDNVVNIIMSPYPLIDYDAFNQDLINGKALDINIPIKDTEKFEAYSTADFTWEKELYHKRLSYNIQNIINLVDLKLDLTSLTLNDKAILKHEPKMLDIAHIKPVLVDINGDTTEFNWLDLLFSQPTFNGNLGEFLMSFRSIINDDGSTLLFRMETGRYTDSFARVISYNASRIYTALPISNNTWNTYYNENKNQFNLALTQANENYALAEKQRKMSFGVAMTNLITGGIASGIGASLMPNPATQIFSGVSAGASALSSGISTTLNNELNAERNKLNLEQFIARNHAKRHDMTNVLIDGVSKGDGLIKIGINAELIGNTGIAIINNMATPLYYDKKLYEYIRLGYQTNEYLPLTNMNDLIVRHRFTYIKASGMLDVLINETLPIEAKNIINADFEKGLELWTPYNDTELDRLGDYTYENYEVGIAEKINY